MDKQLELVDSFRNLGNDWDGQGASAPTQAAINAARRLVMDGIPDDVLIAPTVTGGVLFEWGEHMIEVFPSGELEHCDVGDV